MLKLRRARIRRFKSHLDFELTLPDDLLLLIGQNGVGKSSTLQAFALLREFARGQVSTFFESRNWDPREVRPRANSPTSAIVHYDLVLEAQDRRRVLWEIEWGLKTSRTMNERVWRLDNGELTPVLQFSSSAGLRVHDRRSTIKGLRLGGSVLSAVAPEEISPDPILADLQAWGSGITNLELLSPAAMRRSVRLHADDLGSRGERLAGFLAGLDPARRGAIVDRLRRYYPIAELSTVRKRAGWIDLAIAEKMTGISITSEHVSDGFLRLLAICSIPELGSAASLVMLDEVEDGIEPHILPNVIQDLRRETGAQLILTSHSPILANYVDPDEVSFVGRDEQGRTFAIQASRLRTFRTGESGFGAGEVWINTTLRTLNRQALEARNRQLQREDELDTPSARRLRFVEAA